MKGILRSAEQRKTDVLAVLEGGGHGWLATAAAGEPHVIAVAYWWHEGNVVVATRGGSRTARNLVAGGGARLAIGSSDDAVVVEGRLAARAPVGEAAPGLAEGFARQVGWDPREQEGGWELFVVRPRRVQAYRGHEELEGRDVMRDGRWLA
jgi:hypothetical protein